jgi:hypothetical protein
VPFTFYVDDQGLPARFAMSMSPARSVAAAKRIKMVMVLDYTDWGAPVSIKAPAHAVSADKIFHT